MTDLLPCPFCPDGGKPYIDHSHDPDGCYWAKVKCHTCGASSRGQWASDRSDACPIFYAEVREEWNRRAQPAPGAEPVAWAATSEECSVEALRRDAERYRWLRDEAQSSWEGERGPVLVHSTPWTHTRWREELDAAIDAAIAQQEADHE